MRRLLAALALLAAPALAPGAAHACSPAQPRCEIAGGTYAVRLPDVAPIGAVLFLHGHGGTGAAALRQESRIAPLLAAGYAVIGPDGDHLRGPLSPRSWNAMRDPSRRDDVAFLLAAAEDAARRFHIPRGRIAAAGFSAGGMMTWALACAAPGAFSAFAPVAGTFWRPMPARCAGPAPLFHTHGLSDNVVPTEGRALANGRLLQGDLSEALAMFGAGMGCAADPAPTQRLGPLPATFRAREWPGCAAPGALVYADHPGGHIVPDPWAAQLLRFLDSLAPRG